MELRKCLGLGEESYARRVRGQETQQPCSVHAVNVTDRVIYHERSRLMVITNCCHLNAPSAKEKGNLINRFVPFVKAKRLLSSIET